jgi:hypothetical protein
VHPSWRDLVIDRLAADPAARAAFVGRCGIDGVLLALSTGGGAVGERLLPLLRVDADWDRLLGHIREVIDESDDTDRIRLLFQLAELATALSPEQYGSARAEAAALAADVLSLTGRDPIGADRLALLAAWYVLSASLPAAAVTPPDVTAPWVDTVPTVATDLFDPACVIALETWTGLVAILATYDRATLQRFDFPGGQLDQLGRLAGTDLAELCATLPAASLDTLSETARLLARLLPDGQARKWRKLAGELRVTTSADEPIRDEPLRPRPDPRRDIVSRVLADLRDPPPPPPPLGPFRRTRRLPE